MQNNKIMANSILATHDNRPYVCFHKGGNRLIKKEKSSNHRGNFKIASADISSV